MCGAAIVLGLLGLLVLFMLDFIAYLCFNILIGGGIHYFVIIQSN